MPSYPKGTQELWLSIFPRKSKRNWGSSGGYEWSFQTTSGDRIGAVGMLNFGGFVEGGVWFQLLEGDISMGTVCSFGGELNLPQGLEPVPCPRLLGSNSWGLLARRNARERGVY